jgi:hypothetical protein
MVIQRKGKAIKFEMIQKALETVIDTRAAFAAIERFKRLFNIF